MLIINVKENESIDKALKRFKKKFEKTGVLKELRARTSFEKPSVKRREKSFARPIGRSNTHLRIISHLSTFHRHFVHISPSGLS